MMLLTIWKQDKRCPSYCRPRLNYAHDMITLSVCKGVKGQTYYLFVFARFLFIELLLPFYVSTLPSTTRHKGLLYSG